MTTTNPKLIETLGRLVTNAAARADEFMQNSPVADLDKNLRQHLISQLAKQGLVTREDYEIQVGLLTKTRAKLQELEAKIAALEKAQREKNA